MIKGEEIKKLIVNPAIAGDHHIDDLKLLIEKYSYCGSLYFIYLKAIANVKHVDFESQLKKGDNIVFAAFGGGFTWGSIYLKWAYNTQNNN